MVMVIQKIKTDKSCLFFNVYMKYIKVQKTPVFALKYFSLQYMHSKRLA